MGLFSFAPALNGHRVKGGLCWGAWIGKTFRIRQQRLPPPSPPPLRSYLPLHLAYSAHSLSPPCPKKALLLAGAGPELASLPCSACHKRARPRKGGIAQEWKAPFWWHPKKVAKQFRSPGSTLRMRWFLSFYNLKTLLQTVSDQCVSHRSLSWWQWLPAIFFPRIHLSPVHTSYDIFSVVKEGENTSSHLQKITKVLYFHWKECFWWKQKKTFGLAVGVAYNTSPTVSPVASIKINVQCDMTTHHAVSLSSHYIKHLKSIFSCKFFHSVESWPSITGRNFLLRELHFWMQALALSCISPLSQESAIKTKDVKVDSFWKIIAVWGVFLLNCLLITFL